MSRGKYNSPLNKHVKRQAGRSLSETHEKQSRFSSDEPLVFHGEPGSKEDELAKEIYELISKANKPIGRYTHPNGFRESYLLCERQICYSALLSKETNLLTFRLERPSNTGYEDITQKLSPLHGIFRAYLDALRCEQEQ